MRHSFFAQAFCLSLISSSDARPQLETHNSKEAKAREPRNAVVQWFNHMFKRDDSLERRDICKQDEYYNYVNNVTVGQEFCSILLQYPNNTVTVDYTPTSTVTDLYTTIVSTATRVVRTTPGTTVTDTVTAGAKIKRDAQITARAELRQAEVADFVALFLKRQAADSSDASTSTSTDTSAMLSDFSSACSCQTYGGDTVTETYTDESLVMTLSEFDLTTTTVTTIKSDIPITSTAYTTVAAVTPVTTSISVDLTTATSASITIIDSSTSAPTPTTPAFTCPDDNNTTVSQLLDAERFDYTVLCDTDLTDPTFYGSLYYSTFSGCIAACSQNDFNFQSPVCQGVSYYNAVNKDGYNCFLKSSANNTVPAVGVDSALLLRIVVGITANDTDGTSTEAVPFSAATPTLDPKQMSSSVSAMMGNSTSNMPMITPGPSLPVSGMLVIAAGSTQYSTFVSDGSTYSSGTAYSTYYTSNGSWYETYYTSYTLAWASATTEYAIGAQETSVSSSNNSVTSVESNGDGGSSVISTTNSTVFYPGGYNVTEVISNTTYGANGSEIASTAVTSMFSYATGSASSGTGNSANGESSGSTSDSSAGSESGNSTTGGSTNGTSGGASGYVASGSAPVTSTSFFSTQTVIVNSAGAAGASGYQASGYVTASATMLNSSYGTAYSSGYVASGGIAGAVGASGYAASVALPTTFTETLYASGATVYGLGFVASGMISGTGTSPVPTGSVLVGSGGAGYSSGFAASGMISSTNGSTGTAYSTGFVASGLIPSGSPTTSYDFGNTGNPRVGTDSSSMPIGTASGPPPFYTGPVYSYSTPPVGTSPSTSSPSYSFSQPGAPRSGTILSSSTLSMPLSTGTAPAPTVGPSPYPSVNITQPTPTPSGAPPSYSFSAPGAPSYSYSAPGAPRSPYPVPTGTAPPPFPSAPPMTCSNLTMATTTIYVTSTYFGCFDSCLPQAGSYGGPQSFGPPVIAQTTGETTSTKMR